MNSFCFIKNRPDPEAAISTRTRVGQSQLPRTESKQAPQEAEARSKSSPWSQPSLGTLAHQD